jgi:hypothetical protein
MDLTDTQLDALFTAKALAPKGFVPVEEVVPELEQLVEATWLRTEEQDNGDLSFYWTQQAETALDLSNLTTVGDADLN